MRALLVVALLIGIQAVPTSPIHCDLIRICEDGQTWDASKCSCVQATPTPPVHIHCDLIRLCEDGQTWDASKCSCVAAACNAVGATCGGLLRGASCCAGLQCVVPPSPPGVFISDRPGTCQKPQKAPKCSQKQCGGIAGLECCSGYECEMPIIDPLPPTIPIETVNKLELIHPDQLGNCVKQHTTTNTTHCSKKHKTCAGIAGLQCCEGLTCQMPTPRGGAPIADQAGTCVPPPKCAASGNTCGGLANIQCCAGFRCVQRPFFPPRPLPLTPLPQPVATAPLIEPEPIIADLGGVCMSDKLPPPPLPVPVPPIKTGMSMGMGMGMAMGMQGKSMGMQGKSMGMGKGMSGKNNK